MILGVWSYGEHRYKQGIAVGIAETTVKWDADKLAIQRAANEQLQLVTNDRDTALANNEVIQRDYQTQLSAANATTDELANRLRRLPAGYYVSNAPSAVPKNNAGPRPDATSGSQGDGRLAQLFTSAVEECLDNADQLDALTQELKLQQ
jgi:hypothetical protein